jgi:two-component system chemotaxis response regulator CheB
MKPPRLRLLVVDDSAYNRRNIADVFNGSEDVEVVGKAADGEEALRLVSLLKPDVITLDLEMPRMDGFTFLRILMMKFPTPVIVVSSYAQKENVFKALELGALDFVAKPDRQVAPEAADVRDQILAKVLILRTLRGPFVPPVPPSRRAMPSVDRLEDAAAGPGSQASGAGGAVSTPRSYMLPKYVVAIASSTGGPTALLDVFGRIPAGSPAALLVAQHMPDKFTRTFAERLDRRSRVRTGEAQDGDKVSRGSGFVCPGRQCMEIAVAGPELVLRVGSPLPNDRFVPSADRLLRSCAQHVGQRTIAVVLTGMGDDGLEGAKLVRAAGGMVIAESQETAVVYGMPGAVVRAGLAHHVLPLRAIGEYLANLS